MGYNDYTVSRNSNVMVPYKTPVTAYGIYCLVNDLLRNFLVGRVQRVVIEGKTSSWLNVTSGVPQGSILGPLLFVVFINDIPSSVDYNIDLFADDSVLHKPIFSTNFFKET